MPQTLFESVRHQIIKNIRAAFLAVQLPDVTAPDYVPSNADWPLAFDTVKIGPLSDNDNRKHFNLGIVAGAEKETFQTSFVKVMMQVAIEFRAVANQDDVNHLNQKIEPGELIEEVLTVVKRVITNNRQWPTMGTPLAIDSKITNSETQMDTYADRSPKGVCFFVVEYRYNITDPRDTRPGA